MATESEASHNSNAEEGRTPPKICNVCRLPYEGDFCTWCAAEREHAASVIEERGRRHQRNENGWAGDHGE